MLMILKKRHLLFVLYSVPDEKCVDFIIISTDVGTFYVASLSQIIITSNLF